MKPELLVQEYEAIRASIRALPDNELLTPVGRLATEYAVGPPIRKLYSSNQSTRGLGSRGRYSTPSGLSASVQTRNCKSERHNRAAATLRSCLIRSTCLVFETTG